MCGTSTSYHGAKGPDMKRYVSFFLAVLLTTTLLGACGSNSSASGEEADTGTASEIDENITLFPMTDSAYVGDTMLRHRDFPP